MRRTVLIRVVAAVVCGVFMAGTWMQRGQFDSGWVRFFAFAVTIATVILGLWDTWLWRLPIVQRLPGVPRDIRGTWRGTLRSHWINPATGDRPPPKTIFLVIRQTSTSVSAHLLTDESRSVSTLAEVSDFDGAHMLTYVYLNRPVLGVEHRSPMHHGSTALDIAGSPATRLTGRYWTDRDSKGELDFHERSRRLAEGFVEAVALFAETTTRRRS